MKEQPAGRGYPTQGEGYYWASIGVARQQFAQFDAMH
jgi:hypothetical protein